VKVERGAAELRAAHEFSGSRPSVETLPSADASSANRSSSPSLEQSVPINLTSYTANSPWLIPSAAAEATQFARNGNDVAEGIEFGDSAHAEVYDQLGTSVAAGAEALFNRDTWRDSWKATPLLMILALERIAASNSRRAKKESSESAGRPQLPASADAPDPA
jgi:hypothetical protein